MTFPTLAELEARTRTSSLPATRQSLPEDRSLGRRVDDYVAARPYAVLATTRPDGRPHAAAVTACLHGGRFWMPTVHGAVRLRNVEHLLRASLVYVAGELADHIMVMVEGDVVLHRPPGAVLDGFLRAWWGDRIGGELDWVDAVIELRPDKVLSFHAPDAVVPAPG